MAAREFEKAIYCSCARRQIDLVRDRKTGCPTRFFEPAQFLEATLEIIEGLANRLFVIRCTDNVEAAKSRLQAAQAKGIELIQLLRAELFLSAGEFVEAFDFRAA